MYYCPECAWALIAGLSAWGLYRLATEGEILPAFLRGLGYCG